LCNEIIEESDLKDAKKFSAGNSTNQTPRTIHDHLNRHIINQEHVKKTISVAIYNHYKRIKNPKLKIEKSNILLAGPSGSGKTLFAKTIADLLKVPFAICDATTLTEAGYVGEDVENVLRRLFHNAGNDVEKAERGIIFIDEIDKLRKAHQGPSVTRDVGGEGVQQALLKLIEGGEVEFVSKGSRKHPEKETIKINTTNILFIVGGAFVGLETTIVDSHEKIETEALHKFGIIPELCGRKLRELAFKELKSILTEPENSIVTQYKNLFKLDGYALGFDDYALEHITTEALRRKTGARGLRSVIEDFVTDIAYEIPEDKEHDHCLITFDFDRGCLTHKLTKREKPKQEKPKQVWRVQTGEALHCL
jgi:ATP-dependent Clp protease ATP-binding subunit ClpX